MLCSRCKAEIIRGKGLASGTAPFGFRRQGRGLPLVEDEAEQHTLRQIRQMRDEGRTLREIADALNEAGYLTRRGTPWKFQYVDSILKSVP